MATTTTTATKAQKAQRADAALALLEGASASQEAVRIERRIFRVPAAQYDAASEAAMELVRVGAWKWNLHLSGWCKGHKEHEFVLERQVSSTEGT